jgi:trk system potassium uptake protein TrkH
MNYRLVAKYLGHFTLAIALLMLPAVICAACYAEWSTLFAFVESMLISATLAAVLLLLGRKAPDQMYQREGLALVSIGWLLTAAIGALPYVVSGSLGAVDAYFESMSGFTTTGSTILTDIPSHDKSILFWRSFTHWLGGMGIIVLFIAVLPYLGAGGKQLFKSESPGPDPRGLRPRIKDTATVLYKIYLALTITQTILLMVAGMDLYDALCHTFGTVASAGFSTKATSIAHFDSVAIEVIIITFMVLAGTNFALFFAMMRGDRGAVFRNAEWRVFIAVLVIGTALVTINLMGVQGTIDVGEPQPQEDYTFGKALREASFQVVSLTTTTGYGTANFDAWPHFSRALLLLLMFVGGCAGSTSGGIKIVRFIILVKMTYWRLESTFRPKTIRKVRINGYVIEDDVQRSVYAFFALHMTIFAIGILFMSYLGLPFQSAVSSVIATLNNIGPGIELVGPDLNFAFIPDAGKIFLSLCMAMGRLELFSICVLFIPSFWKHS